MLKVGQSLYHFLGNWIVLSRLTFDKQSYLKPIDKIVGRELLKTKKSRRIYSPKGLIFPPDLLNEGTVSSLIRDLYKNSSFIVPRELAEMASVT